MTCAYMECRGEAPALMAGLQRGMVFSLFFAVGPSCEPLQVPGTSMARRL